MKLVRNLIFVVVAILVVSPVAHSQDAAVLNNTSMGRDQNDARDYINSLQPGPQKYGKGEKKAQINSAELKSKSIKDATFGGSLMNIGIDPSVPKLDAAKEHAAPTEEAPTARKAANEQTSAAPKQTETKEQEPSASSESETQAEPLGGSTFSNLSQTALLADDLNGTTDLGVSKAESKASSSNSSAHSDDTQKKKTDDKSAPEKTTKPDGDH